MSLASSNDMTVWPEYEPPPFILGDDPTAAEAIKLHTIAGGYRIESRRTIPCDLTCSYLRQDAIMAVG